MAENNKLIIIAGPTAVGKSELAVALCSKIGGSVISADSMQIYKYMDIGSAKISPRETGGIKHYLIDVLDPGEEFNVSVFKNMAKEAVDEIRGLGKIPVLTGGTGFYIQALAYDIDFSEGETDPAVRERLEAEAERFGAGQLYKKLKEADPDYARITPQNNVKRVIRALEYMELTGERFSARNERQSLRCSPYELFYFVLTLPRDELYKRIDLRVDKMMEAGLLDEVRRLKEMGCRAEMTSMQGLGYKQLLRYLDGKTGLERAVDDIKKETRHFAKRQLTWFKREKNVIWIDKSEYGSDDEIIQFMTGAVNGR